ncbi:hypothetical protein TNCV_4092391 [Trichonephila clavipes]|nr:hypothetical protein TNCV_4092391 [Trichonephila clavipes]
MSEASSYVSLQKSFRCSQRSGKSAGIQSVRHLRRFPAFFEMSLPLIALPTMYHEMIKHVCGSVDVVVLFVMLPVWLSQIEAHEIHRGKGLEVRMSLALSTIQVTVRISSAKFHKVTIDGDTTYLYLHNFCMELKGREMFSSPLRS